MILLILSAGCVGVKPKFQVIPEKPSAVLIAPHASKKPGTPREFRFAKGPAAGSCISRTGIAIRPAGSQGLVFRVASDAGSTEHAGWLRTYAAGLEASGCIGAGEGFALAQTVSDYLRQPINKPGSALSADLADSDATDLNGGAMLRVVEPIFVAGAGPDARPLQPGETVSNGSRGLTVTLKASPDLAGMRTSWFLLEGRSKRLVYQKEEINIFDADAPYPPMPRRLTNLLPQSPSYYKLLTIISGADDADRGEILIASATLPGLMQLSDAVRRKGNCGERGPGDGCLAVHKGTFISPFITVEVNGKSKLLPADSRLREALESNGSPPAGLRIWKQDGARLLPVDFRRAGAAILDLQLTGGERITFDSTH